MKILVVGEGSNIARSLADGFAEMYPDAEWVNCYWHQGLKSNYRYMYEDADIAEFDAATSDAVDAIVDARPDLIINAAGMVTSKKCFGNELESLRANYLTALRVKQAMEELPDAKVIHLATSSSYADEDKPINENTDSLLFQTAYSLTKLMGEKEILKLPERQRLVLRFAMIYGGMYDDVSFISKLVNRQVLMERGNSVLPWSQNLDLESPKGPLYMVDFVEAIITLYQQKHSGVFVLGNPYDCIPFADILQVLEEVGVYTEEIEYDADGDSLGWHELDITKFVDATGLTKDKWPRYSLEEGVADLLEMYRSHEDADD